MTLFKVALFSNAVFSFTSGVVFLVGASSIAPKLGEFPALALQVIGGGLIVFAVVVARLAWCGAPPRREVLPIILGDLAWVCASAWILYSEPIPLTTLGFWVIATLADIVLVFAILQILGIRKAVLAQAC